MACTDQWQGGSRGVPEVATPTLAWRLTAWLFSQHMRVLVL